MQLKDVNAQVAKWSDKWC